MGLFSFLSKHKQDRTARAAEDSGRFISRAEDDALGERARSKRASNAGEGARRGRDARGGVDPVLPEKKRARRRLVGAVALALAAAVGLPMMLDSEPKPLAGDIAIQIPAKDKAAPLPLPAEPAAKGDSVAAADSVDNGEEIVAPPKTPAAARMADGQGIADARTAPARPDTSMPKAAAVLPKVEHPKSELARQEPHKPEHKSKAEPKPVEPKPAEPRMALPKPAEPKAVEKPVAKPAAKVEEKRQSPEEAARALAILEGKQAVKAPQASAEKVVLQVAALGSAEKVAELQARLREAGIHSFTQKLSRPNGELIRVKVGPFTREEAEKVRARLGKLGLAGTVGPA
jgi:DedD protein